MPTGEPPLNEVLNKQISFYSLDTSVIQKQRYKFATGPLGLLMNGVGKQLKLVVSEVVAREVHDHRVDQARAAARTLEQAIQQVQKLRAICDSDPLVGQTVSASLDVGKVIETYDADFSAFILAVDGEVLSGEAVNIVGPLLDLHSSMSPPFNAGKPNEFKDAMALLSIEAYAKHFSTKGILVSADGDWRRFADNSPHLYYVGSLDEFTDLFASVDAVIRDKAATAMDVGSANFKADLNNAVEEALGSLDIDTDQVTSIFGRVDAFAPFPEVDSVELTLDDLTSWSLTSGEYAVRVPAVVWANVTVEAELYADDFDGGEMLLGSVSRSVREEISADIYLRFRPDADSDDIEDWLTGIDVEFESPAVVVEMQFEDWEE